MATALLRSPMEYWDCSYWGNGENNCSHWRPIFEKIISSEFPRGLVKDTCDTVSCSTPSRYSFPEPAQPAHTHLYRCGKEEGRREGREDEADNSTRQHGLHLGLTSISTTRSQTGLWCFLSTPHSSQQLQHGPFKAIEITLWLLLGSSLDRVIWDQNRWRP